MQCWHLLRSVSFCIGRTERESRCVDSFGFRNVDVREDENILVKSIGSRFTETDKILQKIDEDKFISSSGSAISAVRRKDVSTLFVQ
jgi:acetolactate synthase small subunit